jgi:cell division protein FtsI/penicillin-binding protein 2
MRSFYENDIRRRTKALTFVLAAWGLIVAGRLIQIQLFGHSRAKATVLKQARDEVKVTPQRGRILDRNGEILAISQPAPSIGLRHLAKETPAEERTKVGQLKAALGLAENDAAAILGRLGEGATYTYVKKKASEAEAKRAEALKIAGLEIEPGTKRSYAHGVLACHVLGGMSPDGENRTGVESRYNEVLKGQEGRQVAYEVRDGRDYEVQVLKAPVPGRDITLTIDATIQYIAEKELARAVVAHRAAWGSVIVMDPATGEILALANWPPYDPNSYPYPQEGARNWAVQVPYEPGSTFKIVTAAAARERDLVGYSERFDCTAGFIRVSSTTITDHERFGVLSFPQVLIHSSNVGTVQFAQRLTIPEFYKTIKAFGFGRRTGIDLPREDSGLVKRPEAWTKKISLPHIAIGYEVSVTSIQTLVAMNAFATGGVLVRPRVVKAGALLGAPPAVEDGDSPVRVMSETTAKELVDRVFTGVVEEGTGEDGRLDGFGIAGKTGTAQKLDGNRRVYIDKYTASFVGFTPLGEPRLSMIVVLDSPKEGYYGGKVCAPVFRDIARQVLRYLRVPPERTPPARALTADLRGQKGKRP